MNHIAHLTCERFRGDHVFNKPPPVQSHYFVIAQYLHLLPTIQIELVLPNTVQLHSAYFPPSCENLLDNNQTHCHCWKTPSRRLHWPKKNSYNPNLLLSLQKQTGRQLSWTAGSFLLIQWVMEAPRGDSCEMNHEAKSPVSWCSILDLLFPAAEVFSLCGSHVWPSSLLLKMEGSKLPLDMAPKLLFFPTKQTEVGAAPALNQRNGWVNSQ